VIRITLTASVADAAAWIISRTQILQEGKAPSSFTRNPVVNQFE
jgi:hypothetical protein